MNSNDVKAFLKQHGIPLAGIAPVSRFADVPEGRTPDEIMPGARSVIVFGLPMSDGAVQAKFRALEDGIEEADSVYGRYGRNTVPAERLMTVSYALSHYIERKAGIPAMPMMTGPWSMGRPLSLRHAAVAAGLGQFGLNKAVLTAEYGPRVRWGAVITQLELEADEVYSGESLCGGEECALCRSVCPANAIGEKSGGFLNQEYAKINFNRCRLACYGFEQTEQEPTDDDVEAKVKEYGFKPGGTLRPPTWKCDRCIVYCPAGKWKEKYLDKGLTKFGK